MNDFLGTILAISTTVVSVGGGLLIAWLRKKLTEMEKTKDQTIKQQSQNIEVAINDYKREFERAQANELQLKDYLYAKQEAERNMKRERDLYEMKLLDAKYINGQLLDWIQDVEKEQYSGAVKKFMVLDKVKNRCTSNNITYDNIYWGDKIDRYVTAMNEFAKIQGVIKMANTYSDNVMNTIHNIITPINTMLRNNENLRGDPAFCIGNTIKYILRKKDDRVQDLSKAYDYMYYLYKRGFDADKAEFGDIQALQNVISVCAVLIAHPTLSINDINSAIDALNFYVSKLQSKI